MARRVASEVPEDPRLAAKKAEVLALTDDFCDRYLNAEYKKIVRKLIERVAKETPSPLLRGRADIWAAGVVYAIGSANFLFDRSFPPYISATDLAAAFGVASGSASQKATQLRDRYPIDFPNTDFATKKMREVSDNMAGMLAQSGILFGGGNISIQMPDPDGTMLHRDQFRAPPRSRRASKEFIDADRPVMHDFYELTELLDQPGKKAFIVKKLEKLIEADPDFYDTYLMLADFAEEDGVESRAATLRETAYHRARSRIVDGKGEFPASLPWGYLENRHLVRALESGAIAFWDAGDTDAALDIFRRLLRSNPKDNIGARNYILAIHLGQTLAEHEAQFETESGYLDATKLWEWFDSESSRFPEEFAEWRKQVGE